MRNTVRNNITRVMSVVVILAITITPFFDAKAKAETSELTAPNVAVYDNLLTNRMFVEATFTGEAFPSNNPYAEWNGVSGSDYMYADILNKYETDATYRDGVNVYYRIEHLGETVSEIPSALIDLFVVEGTWDNFVAGAKKKNYNAVLSKSLSNDYQSESGQTLNNELADIQTLRSYYNTAKTIKGKYGEVNEWIGLIKDVNNIYQNEYATKVLPSYSDSIYGYLDGVDSVLNDASKLSGKTKASFSDLYEAQYYALYGADDESFNEWRTSLEIEHFASSTKKYLSVAKSAATVSSSYLDNIVLLEQLFQQRDSLSDTLSRVKKVASSKGDKTFVNVSNDYIDMLSNDYSDDDTIVIEAVKNTLISYATSNLEKYMWSKTTDSAKKFVSSILARNAVSKEATSLFVAQKAEKISNLLSTATFLGDSVTSFGDTCEKIYEIKYLQQIKKYAITAYYDDKDAYLSAKNSGASMAELDELAKNALDDLAFLKRLTLRANEIGYSMTKAQADSAEGKFLDWIAGCDTVDMLNNTYTKMQNAMVDTVINPISQTAFTVGNDEKLTVYRTDKECYAQLMLEDQSVIYIPEFEYKLLGGLQLENASVTFVIDTIDCPVYLSLLDVRDDSDIVLQGIGEIVCGATNIEAYLDVVQEGKCKLVFQGDVLGEQGGVFGDEAALNLGTDVNLLIENNLVLGETKLIINGACVIVNGDLRVQKISDVGEYIPTMARIEMNDENSYLLVKGNSFFDCDPTGAYTYRTLSKFYEGTLELRGDLTDLQSEYGWYGSINVHTEGYGWKCNSNFNMIFSGKNVQKISIPSNESKDLLSCLPVTSFTSAGIEIVENTELYVDCLATDLTFDMSESSKVWISEENNKTLTITNCSEDQLRSFIDSTNFNNYGIKISKNMNEKYDCIIKKCDDPLEITIVTYNELNHEQYTTVMDIKFLQDSIVPEFLLTRNWNTSGCMKVEWFWNMEKTMRFYTDVDLINEDIKIYEVIDFREPRKIYVQRNPDKVIYEENTFFDSTGIEIFAEYENNSTADVTSYCEILDSKRALNVTDKEMIFVYKIHDVIYNVSVPITVLKKCSSDAQILTAVVALKDGEKESIQLVDNNICECILPQNGSVSENTIMVTDITVVPRNQYATVSDLVCENDGNTWKFQITAQDGITKQKYEIHIRYAESVSEYEDSKTNAIFSLLQQVQSGNMLTEMLENDDMILTTEEKVKNKVIAYLNSLLELGESLKLLSEDDLEIVAFLPAIYGNADNVDGEDGQFTVQVQLLLSNNEVKKVSLSGVIPTKKYEGIGNKEIVEQMKTLLINDPIVILEKKGIYDFSELIQCIVIMLNNKAKNSNIDIEFTEENVGIVTVTFPEDNLDGNAIIGICINKGMVYENLDSLSIILPSDISEEDNKDDDEIEVKNEEDKEATDRKAAAAVIEQVKAIGTVTLNHKDAIEKARAAYNALSDDAKKLVSADDLKLLADAEAKYAQLKADKEKADKAAADAAKKEEVGAENVVGGATYVVAKNQTVIYEACEKKDATSVKIPEKIQINGKDFVVTEITANAFKNNKKLTKVTMPKSIKVIGKNAFQNCSALKTATIGSNVTTIGDSAFKGCSKLTKVTIPAKVTKIGKKAFCNCKKLKTVTIKSTSLKSVGSKAFTGCYKTLSIKVPKKKLTAYKKLLKKKVPAKAKVK